MCLRWIPSNSRGDRSQRRPGAVVLRVGLELDPVHAERLERVAEEQVLRLGVRARAPRGRGVPGVPDLEPPVLGDDVQVAGRADHRAVLHDDEVVDVGRRQGRCDPGLRVAGRHPRPGALVGRGRAQPVDVALARSARADDAALRASAAAARSTCRMSTLRLHADLRIRVHEVRVALRGARPRTARRPGARTARAPRCRSSSRSSRRTAPQSAPSFGQTAAGGGCCGGSCGCGH